MNLPLLLAAVASWLLGAMHTVMGECWGKRRLARRPPHSRAFDPENPKDVLTARIVRVAWHSTSITWCGIGVVLAVLASTESTPSVIVALRVIALTFLCCALLSLWIARGRHPSWVLFSLVAAAAFAGSMR